MAIRRLAHVQEEPTSTQPEWQALKARVLNQIVAELPATVAVR